jgi:hypothetical protein
MVSQLTSIFNLSPPIEKEEKPRDSVDSDPAVESDDDSQIQEKPAMEDQPRETTMRGGLQVQLTENGWYPSKVEIFKNKHGLKTMRVVPEHERQSFDSFVHACVGAYK